MSLSQHQRHALCDLFDELGALAPTACEGWKTQDLVAHLYVREHCPAALPGIGLQRFSDATQRIQTEQLHLLGYRELVRRLRRPGWVMLPVDRLVNAVEWSVHHLDVARPNGKAAEFSPAEERVLWRYVWPLAWRARPSTRLAVHSPLGTYSLGQGAQTVHVAGQPSELVYFFTGRLAHADVTITGDDDAVAALRDGIKGF